MNAFLLAVALLAPGTKELEATLEVAPADGGKVFESSDPAKPAVLSGGRTVTGWQVGADGVWRVTLPEVKAGKWNFSQLFVNGERRKRPCVPADGFYLTTDNAYTNEPGMPFCGFVYNPTNVTLRADYANMNDIEVEVFYNWSVARMRLASVDLANRRVRFTSGRKLSKVHSTHKKPRRWHLENVREAFGRAGEWYLDRPTGVLSYRPFPGETPETCTVVAPYLKQLVRVVGERGKPVRDVVFRNVRFRHANVVVPEDGAYVVQGELDVPAAIELNRAENVRFESCAVESVGGWAIAFGPGCRGNAVDSCLLRDLGAGGVKMGAPYGGYTTIDTKDLIPHEKYADVVPGFEGEGKAWDLTGDTRVENCLIVHGGQVYHAGMGVLAARTFGARILHNEIAHFDYTAISVGWDWDNKVVMAHDNEVGFNHCHDLGRRVLSDMGMIYTLGNQPGTTIHDNRLHDIDVYEYGGKGIYLDECTSHVKIYNNLVYDTRCSHSQSYTVDCEVYNNIFFCPRNGSNLLWRRKAGTDQIVMNAHHNIFVWRDGSEMFERCNDFTSNLEQRRAEEVRCPSPAAGTKLDRNLYWKINPADPKRLFRPKRRVNQELPGDRAEHPYVDFPGWQALSGGDAGSLYADPKFVDAGARDFRLKPDSPALKLGFRPFDYRQAGLSDPSRVPAATWDFRHETPEAKAARLRWWTEARFGMFIHYGLYALPARVSEWIRTRERMTPEQYDVYRRHFNPDRFDAREWARIARRTGMRYAVLTAKHHDGFCLWDTAYTKFKVTNTPFGRDLVREFVDAFRAEGLRVGLYYSLKDWDHPDFTIDGLHPLRPKDRGLGGTYAPDSEYDKLNAGRDMARYRQYMKDQTRELLTQYGKIDIMWFDYSYPHKSDRQGKGRAEWDSEGLIALARSLQPHLIVDDRLDLGDTTWGWDFLTPEQKKLDEWPTRDGVRLPWEVCYSFAGTFGYNRDESSWRSSHQLIELLSDSVSKGGNLLLNVGPTSRGKFDARAMARLDGIGAWMEACDRSVYGCTAAPDGFATAAGSALTWNPKTKALYVHLYDYPLEFLPLSFAERIEYAQFLHDGSEVAVVRPPKPSAKFDQPKRNWGGLKLPTIKPAVEVPVVEIFLK